MQQSYLRLLIVIISNSAESNRVNNIITLPDYVKSVETVGLFKRRFKGDCSGCTTTPCMNFLYCVDVACVVHSFKSIDESCMLITSSGNKIEIIMMEGSKLGNKAKKLNFFACIFFQRRRNQHNNVHKHKLTDSLTLAAAALLAIKPIT